MPNDLIGRVGKEASQTAVSVGWISFAHSTRQRNRHQVV